MEEQKKKTEAMLRAVLISSPRGVPLRRLDREFKSITFSSIPFREIGHASLESYIRSIPNVASVTKDLDGEMVVKGVASESDKHVAKLIAKQKKPKKRSKPLARPRRPTFVSRPHASRPVAVHRPMVATRPVVLRTPLMAVTSPVINARPSLHSRSGPGIRFIPPRMMRQAVNQATGQAIIGTLTSRALAGQAQQNAAANTTSSRKVEIVSQQPAINRSVVERGVARQVEQKAQEITSANSRKGMAISHPGINY